MARPSGVRPDGQPYAAWFAAGQAGSYTILEVWDMMTTCGAVDASFRDYTLVCHPKTLTDVVFDGDRLLASETRPL